MCANLTSLKFKNCIFHNVLFFATLKDPVTSQADRAAAGPCYLAYDCMDIQRKCMRANFYGTPDENHKGANEKSGPVILGLIADHGIWLCFCNILDMWSRIWALDSKFGEAKIFSGNTQQFHYRRPVLYWLLLAANLQYIAEDYPISFLQLPYVYWEKHYRKVECQGLHGWGKLLSL